MLTYEMEVRRSRRLLGLTSEVDKFKDKCFICQGDLAIDSLTRCRAKTYCCGKFWSCRSCLGPVYISLLWNSKIMMKIWKNAYCMLSIMVLVVLKRTISVEWKSTKMTMLKKLWMLTLQKSNVLRTLSEKKKNFATQRNYVCKCRRCHM